MAVFPNWRIAGNPAILGAPAASGPGGEGSPIGLLLSLTETLWAPLFIFIGESNSGGAATNTGLTSPDTDAKPQVQILNNTSLLLEDLQIGVNNLIGHTGFTNNSNHGFELGLANAVAASRLTKSVVYLLKSGQGGSVVEEWQIGNASGYWTTFTTRLTAMLSEMSALGVTPVPVVFYSQGINDSLAGTTTATWKTKTQTVHSNLQSLLGASTPIIMTKFGYGAGGANNYSSYNTAIDELVSLPYIRAVETYDSYWQVDGNHFTSAGYELVCQRLIDAYLAVVGSGTASAPSISPASGAFSSSQTVSVSGTGTIKYTTNSNDPLTGTTYSSTFSAAPAITVKAVAIERNKVSSSVATAVYTVTGESSWDATSGGAAYFNFFNGNLSAAHYSTDAWATIKGTVSRNAGKKYFELKCTAGGQSDNYMIALTSSGASTTTYAGNSAYGIGFSSGTNYVNGFTSVNTRSSRNPTLNDVYMIAVDFTAGYVWIGLNGTWIASGDPGAGTNHSASFTPATVGALFPSLSAYTAHALDGKWTLQATSASQSYSPPSGFSAWD